MFYSQKELLRREIESIKLANIKKGDKVKITGCEALGLKCLEADRHKDEVLEVLDNPKQFGGAWCLRIEKEGWFDIVFLEKVI